MLQENIVINDSMCDMLCYLYIVKLQNFLNAPRSFELVYRGIYMYLIIGGSSVTGSGIGLYRLSSQPPGFCLDNGSKVDMIVM